VKWFSWSALVYLLSLLFIWSCGYWLLLQSSNWQLQQQKSSISQQLDKGVALLQDWQQGYQLHLAYLQSRAETLSVTADSTPLADPLQDIDDSIRRVLWPDPLLAYVVLDQDQRVLRFSSAAASNFFSQTRLPPAPEQVFLPPLVFPGQWVMPLRVRQPDQTLLLWFDAAQLQRQLQQLTLSFNHATELLLLDSQAELYSRSRYQIPLLARLGQVSSDPFQVLRLYAKRPPENLLRSQQRYLDAGVWPLTAVVSQLGNSNAGFLSSHYLNYLGRPSLAGWQLLPNWQLYAVVERDASLLLADLAKLKQQLLLLLSATTVLLTLIFWWLHRRLQRYSAQQAAAADWTDDTEVTPFDTVNVGFDNLPDSQLAVAGLTAGSLLAEHPTAVTVASVPAVSVLLEAWLKQADADPRLVDLSRHWLERQQANQAQACWVCPLSTELTLWLQHWQQQHELQLTCILAPSLPVLLQFEQQLWFRLLQLLLQATASQAGLGHVQLTVSLQPGSQLQVELLDLANGQAVPLWLSGLQAVATNSSAPLCADSCHIEELCQLMQPLLQASGGQLVLEPQVSGYLLRWTTPVLVPEFQPVQCPFKVNGRAMLLCPAGLLQQNYQQLLQQAGLELLPLDDSQQLLQWCAGTPLPLDKLIIDEGFVKSDPHLALKVAQVVRRYFPEVQVLLTVSKPERWQQLQPELLLLAKPCTWLSLQQAFVQSTGLVRLQRPKVWLYLPDPLELWWLEQMCQQLGFEALAINHWPQLPGELQQDCYCLPWQCHPELSGPVLPTRLLWCLPEVAALAAEPLAGWRLSDGPASLSEKLFQLLSQSTVAGETTLPVSQAPTKMDLVDEPTAS
jgi:hypothetical protein